MAATVWDRLSERQQRTAIDIMEPAAAVGMKFEKHISNGDFGTGTGMAITGQDMDMLKTQQISFNQ